MGWIKMWNTYRKAKEVFVKPKIGFFIGKWRSDPCLPVWRRGPTFTLGSPYSKRNRARVYNVRNCVNFKYKTTYETNKNGKTYPINHWDTSYHKLPKGIYDWDLVWTSKFRRKLRKFGLGWLRFQYNLPIWLAFHIFNHDLYYKTKWTSTDFRYEFPPQFTIVFFGFACSWWLRAPEMQDSYWECMLHYLYGKKPKSLKNAIYEAGRYRVVGEKEWHFVFKREWVKPKYLAEYDEIVNSCKPKEDELG